MSNAKGGDIGFDITRRGPQGAPGEPLAAADGAPIVFPPTFLPPPNAIFFTLQGELDLAGAATTQFVLGGDIAIPANHLGVIQTVQFFSTVCDATIANFTFSLLMGGNPVPGFTALTIPQLGGTQGINSSPIAVPVPSNTNIGASVTAPNANPHHVGVFIQGWYWPSTRGA